MNKNEKFINKLVDKNFLFFNLGIKCIHICKVINQDLIDNGKLKEVEDLSVFEYCFGYLLNLIEFFKLIEEEKVVRETNYMKIISFVYVYNIYFTYSQLENKDISEFDSKIQKLIISIRENRDFEACFVELDQYLNKKITPNINIDDSCEYLIEKFNLEY